MYKLIRQGVLVLTHPLLMLITLITMVYWIYVKWPDPQAIIDGYQTGIGLLLCQVIFRDRLPIDEQEKQEIDELVRATDGADDRLAENNP